MSLRTFFNRVKIPLKVVFYLVMAAVVIMVARTMFQEVSAEKMKSILHGAAWWELGGVMLLGVVAFLATGLYDLIAARQAGVQVSKRSAFQIGLMSQAFTNFAGMGGLTGGVIRTREYIALGASKTAAVGVSAAVWASNTLGLLVLLLLTSPLAVEIDGRVGVLVLVACLYLPVFLFAGRIRIGHVDLRATAYGAMPMREKLAMIAVSAVDWIAAGLFFWVCIRLFEVQIDPWHALFIYATATVVGVISFLPSGLGSFDVTVLLLFHRLGVDTSSIALALIVFRIAYYLIPWLGALAYWGRKTLGLDEAARRQTVMAHSLWVTMVLSSAVLFASAFTPEITSRVRLLQEVVPDNLRQASHLTLLMMAVVLLVLARGINKRIRRAWELALVVNIIAIFALLIRGLDWEEAVLMFLFALGLVAARGAFTYETMNFRWRDLAPSMIPVLVLPVALYIWHGFHAPVLLYTFFAGIVALAGMFSRHRLLSFTGPGVEETKHFEELLATYGGNSYTHLFYLGDKEIFSSSDGQAALLYRPYGRILYGLGDPFGDPDSFHLLVGEFIAFADENHMSLVIYELDERHLSLYADEGFTFTKLGEDATVDISAFTVVGNRGKTMRRIINHFREEGLTFEVLPSPLDADTLKQLREISAKWLGSRQEMGFSLGRFEEDYIQRAPVAVACSQDRIEAFATLMPVDAATTSVDLMRIRPDAPSGTMDGIFAHLMRHAHEQGYSFFNLGMAPMSNTGNRPHSHGREKLLHLVYDYGGKVYGFHGLRTYKQKFKPRWSSRYLASLEPTKMLPALLGLLELIQRPDRYEHVTIPGSEQLVRED